MLTCRFVQIPRFLIYFFTFFFSLLLQVLYNFISYHYGKAGRSITEISDIPLALYFIVPVWLFILLFVSELIKRRFIRYVVYSVTIKVLFFFLLLKGLFIHNALHISFITQKKVKRKSFYQKSLSVPRGWIFRSLTAHNFW